MQLKIKLMTALIAVLTLAVPGAVMAQNPDLTQNPSPDQATMPSQDQGQYQDQNQDQDMRSAPNESMGAPQNGVPQYNDQNGQNERPPMSEEPPPLKPSPNIMGPGPSGPPPSMGGPSMGPGAGGQGDLNQTSSNNGVARVSMIHGDVSTRRGDAGEWSAAQLNGPLMAGDSVSTGDKSRVELQLDYANILRLAEHTQANITNLTRSQIQIQLGHGMANFTVLRNSDADAEIDTPNVSVRSERREASFRILVTADDHTEVLVRRGEVEITTPQGGTRVGANQFITIRGNGADTQYRIGEAPPRDDWDQWNTDRDRMITNSVSRSRTNDYYTGTQDLDANGNWQNVPDYGQAWFPNVPPGWVPYSAGTWVWQPYWGWTWVSYEPWGWAPYHYGRWFLYNGAWGWWPGPVYGYPYYRPIWAPAYVSFFGFGGGFGVGFGFGWGSIGWFPIGPCDFFHPWWGAWGGRFGYTGFYGWNRGGFAPLHGGTRFSNVWAAQHDPNFRGATSVAANRFGQGRTAFSPVGHGELQNAHFATGNLPVTPTRASLSASGRPAAPGTLVNRGGSHFFSPHGTTSAATGRTFEREQSQISNSMRQSGVSPVNGQRGGKASTNYRQSVNGFHSQLQNREESPGNRESARTGNTNQGSRGFGQSNENGSRTTGDNHGYSNSAAMGRSGNLPGSESGREGTGVNNGGWQKFTPMAPRSSSESAGRSSSPEGRSYSDNRSENNRSYSENRSSENRGYSEGRSYGGTEDRGGYGASRSYPGSEGHVYSGGRPTLNMRQPIVTPRGSYPGFGGRAPSYGGGRAPSFGGSHAPSFGGHAPSFGGHSAPSGHSGGGGSHGGGGHGHR
jgi:FecR protein